MSGGGKTPRPEPDRRKKVRTKGVKGQRRSVGRPPEGLVEGDDVYRGGKNESEETQIEEQAARGKGTVH